MSDRDNKIDKIFNKSFEDFEITPSERVWGNIKNELDRENKTDRIFNESFEDFEITPSERVWNNVENELEKESYKRRTVFYQQAAAGLLLITLTLGIYVWQNKDDLNRNSTTYNGQTTIDKNLNAKPDLTGNNHKANVAQTALNKQTVSLPNKIHVTGKIHTEPIAQIISIDHNKTAHETIEPVKTDYSEKINENKNNIESVLNEYHSENTGNSQQEITFNSLPNLDNTNDLNNASSIKKQETNNDLTTGNNTGDSTAQNIEVTQAYEVAIGNNRKDSSFVASDNKISISDNTNVDYVKPLKWFVGAFISPDYSCSHLKAGTNTSEEYIKTLNKGVQGRFLYTSGLKISRKINNQLTFCTGLQYSVKGFNNNSLQTKVDSTSTPFIPTGITVTNQATVQYNYFYYNSRETMRHIEIPVIIQYSKTKNRLSTYMSVGISINLLLNAQSKYYYTSGKIPQENSTNNYKKINFGLSGGIGIMYKLTSKLYLGFEPSFRYSLISANKDQSIKIFPYSIAANTGLYYHF